MRFQKIRVCLKELDNKSLERNEVNLRVWVEEVKVDLNSALPNKASVNNFQKKKKRTTTVSDPLSPSSPSLCPCFRFGIVKDQTKKGGALVLFSRKSGLRGLQDVWYHGRARRAVEGSDVSDHPVILS